jgi:hypothetical protein
MSAAHGCHSNLGQYSKKLSNRYVNRLFAWLRLNLGAVQGSIADLKFALFVRKSNVEISFLEPGAPTSHNTDL